MKAAMAGIMIAGVALAHAAGGQSRAVLVDPANGDRWELCADPGHPGGPGILTRIAGESPEQHKQAMEPVVRAGEAVVVEQTTDNAAAWLEGVALRNARRGEAIEVKLKPSGWRVRAIAVAPGRMRLQEGVEP